MCAERITIEVPISLHGIGARLLRTIAAYSCTCLRFISVLLIFKRDESIRTAS